MFWKWQKLLHQNLFNFWIKRQIFMNFWPLKFKGWNYAEIIWILQQWCHLYDRPEIYWVMCYDTDSKLFPLNVCTNLAYKSIMSIYTYQRFMSLRISQLALTIFIILRSCNQFGSLMSCSVLTFFTQTFWEFKTEFRCVSLQTKIHIHVWV